MVEYYNISISNIVRNALFSVFILFLFSCKNNGSENELILQNETDLQNWLAEYDEISIKNQENIISNPFQDIKFYVTSDEGDRIRARLPKKYRRNSIYAGISLNYKKIEALIDSVNSNSPEISECVVRIFDSTMKLPLANIRKDDDKIHHIRIGEVTETPGKVNVVLSFFNVNGEELIVYSDKVRTPGKRKSLEESYDLKLNGVIFIERGVIFQVEDPFLKDSKISFHYEIYRVTKNRDTAELFSAGYAEMISSKYVNHIPIGLPKNFLANDLVIAGIDSVFFDGINRFDLNLGNNIFSYKLNKMDIDEAGDYYIEKSSVMLTNNSAFTDNVLSFGMNYRGKMFSDFTDDDVMVINLGNYKRSLIIANPKIYSFYVMDIFPGRYLMIINPNRLKPEKIMKNNYFTFTISD